MVNLGPVTENRVVERWQKIPELIAKFQRMLEAEYGDDILPTECDEEEHIELLKIMLTDMHHFARSLGVGMEPLLAEVYSMLRDEERLACGIVVEDGDEITMTDLKKVVCEKCCHQVIWDEDDDEDDGWIGSCGCDGKIFEAEISMVFITVRDIKKAPSRKRIPHHGKRA